MQSQTTQTCLPSLTLYRKNCHSSHQSHFAYLSSTTQIKLLTFQSNSNQPKIINTVSITIPLQPIKSLSLYNLNGNTYIAVASLTKMSIYCGKDVYYQNLLKIDNNIVEWQKGYIGVTRCKNGFIFARRNGQLHFFDILQKSKIITNAKSILTVGICSIACNNEYIYLGNQQGIINCINITELQNQHYNVSKEFDTTSKLPIINIVTTHKQKINQVICSTCQGQIYICDKQLKQSSCISIHRALISRILTSTDGKWLYTVGQDHHVYKFQILGERRIKLIQNWMFQKIVSLLFQINNKIYISFYQTPVLKQL